MIKYKWNTRDLARPIYICLGEELKQARLRKRFSQAYVGQMLECSAGTIGNYEKGVTTIPVEVYDYLCTLLQVDPDETLFNAYRRAYLGMKRYVKTDADNK